MLKPDIEQINLFLLHDQKFLEDYLEKSTCRRISLTITDNSIRMLSFKIKGDVLSLRLHRIFLCAGFDVLDEIADFICDRKKQTVLIKEFIKQNTCDLKKKACRNINLKTQGRLYNLSAIFDSLNRKYFNNRISCKITWGIKRNRHYTKRKTLGSYSTHNNLIRINPLLDRENVPEYFVEFIVYHEMLHAELGVEQKNGRRSLHSKEFRKREKMFEFYEKAIRWEKNRIL